MKERVKLIVPPYNFITKNEGILPIPPLGIAYLCDFMTKNGWDVEIEDLDIKVISNKSVLDRMLFLESKISERKVREHINTRKKDPYIEEAGEILLKLLNYEKYSIFGFSLIERLSVKYALILARAIKEKKKNARIISGGQLAENIVDISSKNLFDLVVMGRGENPLLDFCKKDKKLSKERGKTLVNMDSPSITLKNRPNFNGLSLNLYTEIPTNYAFHNFTKNLVIPYIYSYGCPYGCTFCGNSMISADQKKMFKKDAWQIIDDLVFLKKKFKTSFFAFYNEYVHSDEKTFQDLCLKLEETKLDLTLAGCVRGNLSVHNISLMASAGFKMVTLGIESGSDRILSLMRKGTRRKSVENLIEELDKNKIFKLCYIIVGFPGEKEENFQETFSFIQKNINLIDQVSISIFRLERCYVRSFPEKFGIRIRDGESSNFSYHTSSDLPEYDEIKGKKWKEIKIENGRRFYILHRLFYLHKKIPQYFYRSSLNEIMYFSRKYCDPKRTQIEIRKLYEKFRQNKPFYLRITDNDNIRNTYTKDKYLSIKTSFDIKEILKIIGEEKNKKELVLLGGEPTMVPELPKIIAFAKRKGWEKVTLWTNGRMFFYKNYALLLKDAGLCKLVVSIYGHNAKTHDDLTKVKGSFEQTIQGICFWKKIGGKVEIVPNILEKNEKHLYEMFKLDWLYSNDAIF